MAKGTNTFHWSDYLIFVLTLVLSAVIGIFYAWKDKRKQNTSDFLPGGRKMSLFPVTLSLMASFLSAILVLGVPTEIFYNGTMYWMISFSNILTFPFAVHAILPVFHNLNITSAYEVCFDSGRGCLINILTRLQNICILTLSSGCRCFNSHLLL